ncbi:MAG: hypothetical protein AAB564_01270 [Patescibacteria group bacterium]
MSQIYIERPSIIRDQIDSFGKTFSSAFYLLRFAKNNFAKQLNLKNYSFVLTEGAHYVKRWDQKVYCDAFYNLIFIKFRRNLRNFLAAEDHPLAVISFDIGSNQSILIRQIQGVKNEQEQLRMFRWEKMLIQILIDFARENKMESVKIIAASESRWFDRCNGRKAESFHLRYNVTPERMGFKLNEFKTYRVLNLNS